MVEEMIGIRLAATRRWDRRKVICSDNFFLRGQKRTESDILAAAHAAAAQHRIGSIRRLRWGNYLSWRLIWLVIVGSWVFASSHDNGPAVEGLHETAECRQCVYPCRENLELSAVVHSPRGRHKAAVFFRFGFRRSAWQELAQALINHARQYDIVKEENTSFGVRYVIEGDVDAPDGRMLLLRSVWFVEKGQSTPHFVTAYRLKGARRA